VEGAGDTVFMFASEGIAVKRTALRTAGSGTT